MSNFQNRKKLLEEIFRFFWKGSSKNDFLKVVSNTVGTSELIYHFVIIVKYFCWNFLELFGTFWNFLLPNVAIYV